MSGLITSGPVKDFVMMKIRAHGKTSDIVVHLQHVLVRVSRIQKHSEPCQQQHVSVFHLQTLNKKTQVKHQNKVKSHGMFGISYN